MSMPSAECPRVLVIGGGAAGMMAAGSALEAGAAVTVLEGKSRPGRKVAITGKGRCNVTNDCTPQELLSNVPRNPRFLYAAMAAFPPSATMAFFEEHGVPLKTERGRRVFPQSDRALDIVDALIGYSGGAEWHHEKVEGLCHREDGKWVATTAERAYVADAVILATGGKSYPLTGSDGSGYQLAARLGHTVTALTPSLVPLTSPDPDCPLLMGLALKNVGLRILPAAGGKLIYEDFGEMLFTHFGLSGPMILSASAHLRGVAINSLVAEIDLKPALDEKTLDARLCSDFAKYANRNFANALGDLLPSGMIPVMVRRSGIAGEKKVNAITREERKRLLACFKHFRVPLSDFRPIEEAIITSGGIEVKEVDPKTMMSKKLPGLFFAGEILDVDAYTGGYNLQIAFATGVCAGRAAAAYINQEESL
ncbi:MAG: NAD(P)/FAD-dependent oxidoreductase [Clostridia bacterium]|nr:NAD(P)/FAD-dependent oxidoreductase [Clostridia bacterium]